MIETYFGEHVVSSLGYMIPEIMLLATFVTAIILDLIFSKVRNIAGYVSLIGLITTGIFLLLQPFGQNVSVFSDMVAVDPFATMFKWIILLSSIVVVVMSFFSDELNKEGRSVGEYYFLIVGMAFGMFLLSGASNLIMIYLAIETMSMSSYVLAGYTKELRRSSEASLKYVIYGSTASGIMIYGISLIFGMTGTLNLYEINQFMQYFDGNMLAFIVAGLMVLVGFGYKISAVPFHFWTPDVYEGAPVTITAYLSVASKAAGFAVLIRYFMVTFVQPGLAEFELTGFISQFNWQIVLAVLSVLTMTVGNFVALWQENAKRLLAYSSIAHAGYALMAVVVMNEIGISAVLVYFFFYLLMNLGAFYVIMLLANKIDSEQLDDYVGIGYKAPALGVMMTLFLVSLTGLPPTAGFIGKLYVFSAVLDSGWIWLAVIGILNSVVSLYYYMLIVRNMWIRGVTDNAVKYEFKPASMIMLYILAIPTLLFGVWFTPIVSWAEQSVKIFIGN